MSEEKKTFKIIRFGLPISWIKRKKKLKTRTWEQVAKKGVEDFENEEEANKPCK
jgi:hypothetical protein